MKGTVIFPTFILSALFSVFSIGGCGINESKYVGAALFPPATAQVDGFTLDGVTYVNIRQLAQLLGGGVTTLSDGTVEVKGTGAALWLKKAVSSEGQGSPRALRVGKDLFILVRLTEKLGVEVTPGSGESVLSIAGRTVTVQSAPVVTIVCAGDLIFSPRLLRAYSKEKLNTVFEGVRRTVSGADFAFANLEGCISERGKARKKQFTFRAPPLAAQVIAQAGFDATTLANNHAYDYGEVALLDTLRFLDQARIAHTGAGANLDAALHPCLFASRGVRLALSGFCDIPPGGIPAGKYQAGVALLVDSEGENWRERVRHIAANLQGRADVKIATVHWGLEGKFEPTMQQKQKGKALLEAGFDAVIGHHPHRLQGIEVRNGKLIVYSLGNFVHYIGSLWGQRTFLLRLRANRWGLVDAQVVPIRIVQGAPQVATGSEAQAILSKVRELSGKLGTLLDSQGRTWIATPYE